MTPFQRSLNRLHRTRQMGRFFLLLLGLVTITGVLMLMVGFTDYHYALSQKTRGTLTVLFWISMAAIVLVQGWRIFSSPREATAALADQATGDSRKRSLSGTYLSAIEAETPMEQFHLEKALEEAAEEISQVPLFARLPFKAIGATLAVTGLVVGTIWGVKQAAPEPFAIVAKRVLDPSGDTAPYSPLIFTVTPDSPQAIYQGKATVHVEITGGEIEEDVYCLVKNPNTGEIDKVPTFLELPGKYARKFEQNLEPVEFAFATGRARSDWHQLDVLFQPRISKVEVSIQPPSYTGRPAQEFAVDSGEIKALEGSTITLTLESNRPLSGGKLSLKALNKESEGLPEEIEAKVIDQNRAAFTFSAHRSSQLSALITDIRSTPAEKPFALSLKTVPDLAPVVDINEPGSLVLATPRSKVPMSGEVEDDHGLAKVSLTRTLVGYRDRNRPLADDLSRTEFDFEEPLDLEPLGVEPGQVLEFYVEAADRNPSLLGLGVSDVVRVQIISEDDYAQRIRDQFKLEQFTQRYRLLADAVRESREALQELADADDKESYEKAFEKAAESQKKAEELARKIADDFKAFNLEDQLKEAAREAADALAANRSDLPSLDPMGDRQELRDAIEKMQDRLGGPFAKAEAVQQDADFVRKVGDVMAMAAEFQRILKAQKSIVTRLGELVQELAVGRTANLGRLGGLSRLQTLNRESLERFASDLRERADALPEDAAEMKSDVDEFLSAYEVMDIPDVMSAAATAAEEGKSKDAYIKARLVIDLMERLIDRPDNGF